MVLNLRKSDNRWLKTLLNNIFLANSILIQVKVSDGQELVQLEPMFHIKSRVENKRDDN